MYLAYFDDSGTRSKDRKYQVLTAVVMEDESIFRSEATMGLFVENMIPPDRLDKFEEFHAWELYGGYGIFDGIEQNKRFTAMRLILKMASNYKCGIVFGAVHHAKLNDQLYASADPVDICFRICAQAVNDWIRKNSPEQMGVVIVDDCQNDIKNTLRKSFRQLRGPFRPMQEIKMQEKKQVSKRLAYLHDAMYFGNSKDSIGIQLADMCCYVIAKHLEGDEAIAGFYDLIKEKIIFSQIEPKE